jgi:hypothetical protein
MTSEFIKEKILLNYCYNIILEDNEVVDLVGLETADILRPIFDEFESEMIIQKTRCRRATEDKELADQQKAIVLEDGHVLVMSFDNFLTLSKKLLPQKINRIDLTFLHSPFVQKIITENCLLSYINDKSFVDFGKNSDDGGKIVKIAKLSPSAMRYCIIEKDDFMNATLDSAKQQNLQGEALKQVYKLRNEHYKINIIKRFLEDLNTGILDQTLNKVNLNCITWNIDLQFKGNMLDDKAQIEFSGKDSRAIGKDPSGNLVSIKLMPEYIKHFPNLPQFAENLILILGSYDPKHIDRIEFIKKYIKDKYTNYWPAFLKDLKQVCVETNDENLSNYIGLSRFVIVEDSFPGGKDFELGVLLKHPGTITIILREEGKRSTTMTNDFEVTRLYTKRLDYNENSLKDMIDKSITEAENMLQSKKSKLDTIS